MTNTEGELKEAIEVFIFLKILDTCQKSCHAYESPSRMNNSYQETYVKHSIFPTRVTQTYFSPGYDNLNDVHYTPLEGYRSRYNRRINSSNVCHYLTSHGAVSCHTIAPTEKLPDFVELSPNRLSPAKETVCYYPLRHSAHNPVDWHLEEAKRRAAEEESRLIEAEQRRRWADEDAEREARKQKIDQDRKDWEDRERAIKQDEDAERENRNIREQERRDNEKADREKEQMERRLRDQKEKEQREKDLEERKRNTDELLKQKVKEDLENAQEYKKSMPKAYDAPLPEVQNIKPEKRMRKKKSKCQMNNINLQVI